MMSAPVLTIQLPQHGHVRADGQIYDAWFKRYFPPPRKKHVVEATVQKIYYRNNETGWTPFSIGGAGGFTGGAVGCFSEPLTIGTRLRLSGYEIEYRGLPQLDVAEYEILPRELHNGHVLALARKGISKDLTELAEKTFGKDFVSQIARDASLLTNAAFKRRKQNTLDNFAKICREIGSISEIENALLEAGAKAKDIGNISKIFDRRHSPYDLVTNAKLSFVKADDLANTALFSADQKWEKDRIDRVEGLICQIMNDAMRSGNCGVSCDGMTEFLLSQYDVAPDVTLTAINNLLSRKFVAQLKQNGAHNVLWTSKALRAERNVEDFLHAHLTNPPKTIVKNYSKEQIERTAKKLGFAASEQQIDGICKALNSPLSIITGGPGTGKTTSLKIIQALLGNGVQACAFAGRAASHLEETTKIAASTIHRLIGLRGGGTKPSPDNLRKTTLLIIEEASMIASDLLAKLLFAAVTAQVPRILFVGDPDQLSPIGIGEPFLDLIASGWAETTHLTAVHRTKAGGGINLLCEDIRQDKELAESYNCVELIEVEKTKTVPLITGPLAITDEILNRYDHFIKTGTAPEDILILSPFKTRDYGTRAINQVIRNFYKRSAAQVGEPVLCTANDYDAQTECGEPAEVFNGERGSIVSVKPNAIVVEFDAKRRIVFEQKPNQDGPAKSLSWAYALTIHKAQGGQAKHVVLVIPPECYLFTKSALYTGASRAAETLTLIGDLSQIPKILKTGKRQRLTALHYLFGNDERIQKEIAFAAPDLNSIGDEMPEHEGGL